MLKSGRFVEATKDTINYDWYLEVAVALSMLIGSLAIELQKHTMKSRILQLAKITLAATLKKLKKDRPDIEGLCFIETFEKLINP